MRFRFPEGFFFGAATSAHQVEGENLNDWTEWEKKNASRLASRARDRQWPGHILESHPSPLQEENYISGRACAHYERFEEDFDIAQKLGHTAHRFSIEWSRIEPEEGKFDEKEIEHYRAIIKALRAQHIEPFATLWHWTLPLWLRDRGGITSPLFVDYFNRYATKVVESLKEHVTFWMTLNEPTSVLVNSYLRGIWPPGKKNVLGARRAAHNLARAHRNAFASIHSVKPNAHVGLGHLMKYVEPYTRSLPDRLAARLQDYYSNDYFLNLIGESYDYLALQYYFHTKVRFPWTTANDNKKVSDLGWELYPEGIYHLLKKLHRYRKPIYITENGLADARDAHRAWFIKESIRNVARAIREGIDVRGYFYWSLLDNFEWDKGFWPRFGLVEVDYHTMDRAIRPSALAYKKVIEEGLELND